MYLTQPLDSGIIFHMDTKELNPKKRPELEKSEIIAQLPMACMDERAAVEFIEGARLQGATSPAVPNAAA